MAYEIERKFLVEGDTYKTLARGKAEIMQAYIARTDAGVVRVRTLDNQAFITLKSRNTGIKRNEWEYEIPLDDALQMMQMLAQGNIIVKTRWYVDVDGHTWEVDEFHDSLEGLCVAEIELKDEAETFTLPTFIGREVTGERRFYNSVLSQSRPGSENLE